MVDDYSSPNTSARLKGINIKSEPVSTNADLYGKDADLYLNVRSIDGR